MEKAPRAISRDYGWGCPSDGREADGDTDACCSLDLPPPIFFSRFALTFRKWSGIVLRKRKDPWDAAGSSTKERESEMAGQEGEIPMNPGKYDEAGQRWAELPDLAPCWRGDFRRPVPEGRNFASQTWCDYWKTWINPNGLACRLCERGLWPEAEKWRRVRLPGVVASRGRAAGEEALVEAVRRGRLSEEEGKELAEEFFPD